MFTVNCTESDYKTVENKSYRKISIPTIYTGKLVEKLDDVM